MGSGPVGRSLVWVVVGTVAAWCGGTGPVAAGGGPGLVGTGSDRSAPTVGRSLPGRGGCRAGRVCPCVGWPGRGNGGAVPAGSGRWAYRTSGRARRGSRAGTAGRRSTGPVGNGRGVQGRVDAS